MGVEVDLTTVYVMRHGEVHNPEGLLYGRMPGFNLSEHGQSMAKTVAEWFLEKDVDITLVVSSPLERAVQSATPTAQAYNLEIQTNPDLIEADNHFAGLPVNRDRSVFLHPQNLPAYRNPFRPSWGEPYKEIVKRMVRAVKQAKQQANGHAALLVSHQLPIWELRRFVEGKTLWHDPRKRQCSLASLTAITFADDTIISLAYYEPAAEILKDASDMTPGDSVAATHLGQ